MLASILPGLRDLRAPLAAGYAWIVIVYLAWKRPMPDGVSAIVEDLDTFVGWTGKAAALAALTFLAYVVGLLSNGIIAWLLDLALRVTVLTAAVLSYPILMELFDKQGRDDFEDLVS